MKRPRVGVFKLTSCDGCQLAILNLGEEFLDLIEIVDISYFKELMDRPLRQNLDIALVEGSISTERQKDEIIEIRERAMILITIGACATSGGLQALRNWASLAAYKEYVYPRPDVIDALSTSTPVSDHVYVDYELWGCPINKDALSETIISFIIGKRPTLPRYSLCMECKKKGIPCILVSRSEPCLGPVTKAGCGAICMSLSRPCYGCFGPREDANIDSLLKWFQGIGLNQKECALLLDKMNSYAYRKTRIEKGH
jgi:sulfhydrogenase subunit delta